MLKLFLVFTKRLYASAFLIKHKQNHSFCRLSVWANVFNIQCSDAYVWGFVYKREGQWFGEQVTSRLNTFRHNARAQLSFQKNYV